MDFVFSSYGIYLMFLFSFFFFFFKALAFLKQIPNSALLFNPLCFLNANP